MTDTPFTADWLRSMIRDSLIEPRTAAERLLTLALPQNALWTWLLLLAVLNGLVYSLTMPSQAELGVMLPGFVQSPLVLAGFMAVLMVVMTWFFMTAGRLMGGEAQFLDMLQVTCWLQSLRLAFQLIVMLVIIVSPGIGGILSIVGGFWGIYILVNFLAEVHRFDTPLRAVGVMVLAVIGVAFALSFLLALFGMAPQEVQ